jgi:predicted amidohydrolase
MTDIVRVAGAQIDIGLADKAGNLHKALNCCREAAEKDARVVIFPELTLTGYNIDDTAEIPPLAESVPGPATNEIQKICQDLDILVLFGLIEHAGSEFYNSAVLIDPGGVAGNYRKIHLPYLGGDRFLTPGNRPFTVCETRYGRLGWIICYDGSFPECARILALQGAEMVALCTNWPDDPDSPAPLKTMCITWQLTAWARKEGFGSWAGVYLSTATEARLPKVPRTRKRSFVLTSI